MTRIPDHGWKDVDRILRQLGFRHTRTKGDHLVYERDDMARPVIVPKWDSIPRFIVANIMRTAGVTKKAYIVLLSGDERRHKQR